MPRTWSKEQREAQSRRMKAPQVTIGPTEEQLIIAQHQGKIDVSQEDIFELASKREAGQEDSGSITHQRPGTVRLYKPTARGYSPRNVPVTNLPSLLANGWKSKCPDCGGDCGPDPNACPGREKMGFRVCPVPSCGKKIHDFQAEEAVEVDVDPNLIKDGAYIESTPATRTKAAMDIHILARHPQEARAAGLIDVRAPVVAGV